MTDQEIRRDLVLKTVCIIALLYTGGGILGSMGFFDDKERAGGVIVGGLFFGVVFMVWLKNRD